jgi:ATP-dependent Zn protease
MRTIQEADVVAYHEAAHASVAALLGILRNDAVVTILSGRKGDMVLAKHLMQSSAPGSWESIHDPV